MSANTNQDFMQVCHNGHVITDLLHTYPERSSSHCERCGAPTLDRCPTCGNEILGAIHVPGLDPVGTREAPQHCAGCGATFPWAAQPAVATTSDAPLITLERMLRRLPKVIRQLRVRQSTDRPPFRIVDERDLEDLLRCLLPLHFDDIRPESRTAPYASASSTDFLLEPHGIVLTSKRTRSGTVVEAALAKQIREDASHYELQMESGTLVCFVLDPEMLLRDRAQLEIAWSKPAGNLAVKCIIA
jgi:hypothetical protein